MLQIRRIFQLLEAGHSQRKISVEQSVSRNTIKSYIEKAEKSSKSNSELLGLDDQGLFEFFNQQEVNKETDIRLQDIRGRLPNYIKELGRTGVTRQLLWEEYIKEVPDGYSYSQFCDHLASQLRVTKAVMHFDHEPGAVLQVDFAGDNIHYVDRGTGEIIDCPVLVCVLPYSHYTYIEALASAKQEFFFAAMCRALTYFGGVPHGIKSDNMKQYVVKSCKYEPAFTVLAEQWSLHYQTNLLAARVRKPRDKASVEKGVDLAYKRVYAPMRDETYYSVDELNQRIFDLLYEHNHRPMQNRQYSRYERFAQNEQPLLLPLPGHPFIIKHTAEAKVDPSYHVTLGEDWHHYSVPYQHIGKKVRLVYDALEVEIYLGHQRVSLHKRGYRKHGYTTVPEHMPSSHRHYVESKGWDADYFLSQAFDTGENTGQIIKRVLESRFFTEQTFKSCLGILRLSGRYGKDRLEAACKRALPNSMVNYKTIKSILERNLDKQSNAMVFYDSLSIPGHDNLRGSNEYC